MVRGSYTGHYGILHQSRGLLAAMEPFFDPGVCLCLLQVTESHNLVASGAFDTQSRALAINNDSIYRAAENRLEVCNTAGE